jgi:transcriptional regulator with GAF, ATPase, and Fis domain
VLDAVAPTSPCGRFALWQVDEVRLGRSESALATRTKESNVRVLRLGVRDLWMSSQHAKLSTVMQRWVLEDTKSKNGVRVNGAAVHRAELADGDVIELGRTFFLFRAEEPLTEGAALDVDSAQWRPPAPGLATLSLSLAEAFDQLAHVATSAVTVALRGPTGTGKEVLARALHGLSGRAGPFVAVNCGALPETLVESVLFGHRKGAFSGATEDRPGYVRAAHGGTLFLDEVGDLPIEAQPALLRVLQERVVTPVGDTTSVPVDVRLVSATHHDLEALARAGTFREDLRGRLSGLEVELPPLAERREDLGLLLGALLTRIAPQRAPSMQLSLEAARALFAYRWPLNVRELEKALEAAVALAGTGANLELKHFPAAVREAKGRPLPAPDVELPSEEEAALKERLASALSAHGGNISAVARELGKARMQVQRWMARFGFDASHFKK